MDTLISDLRYAVRKLARAPGFTFVALLTLALGIGANSAIFSVVYGVLFRPLPFHEPDRLVRVDVIGNGNVIPLQSSPNFVDVRAQDDVFESVTAYNFASVTLTNAGDPLDMPIAFITAEFFEVLGVRPQIGRAFTPADNQPGNTRTILLSNGLWQQRFGGDPSIVGQTVTVEREPHMVAGVMPPGFDYPGDVQGWVPMEYTPTFASPDARGGFFLTVLGRLREGVTSERAEAAMKALGERIDAEWSPPSGFEFTMGLTTIPLREATIGEVRTPLLVLLGAVGFVLLIACANVANLLLARASIRETEMAVRTAIGAGRGRIVRQLVTESLVLGVIGGVLGLVLALWGSAALVRLQPGDLPRLGEVRVDGAVILFTLGIALLSGLLFGLLPALQSARITPYSTLREGGRGQFGTRRSQQMRSTLVVAEIALAVLLLAGAGLLIRSFATLMDVDPGFSSERVAAFRIGLPGEAYPSDEARAAFFDQYLERVRALPGVTGASAVSILPLQPFIMRIGFEIEAQSERFEEQSMDVRVVSPGYFETLGIPVRRGRALDATDRPGALPAAVINEAAARRFFADGDPLGRTLVFGLGRDSTGETRGTIVGVVGDVKLSELGEDPMPTAYFAHPQVAFGSMNVVVRTQAEPLALTARLRDELHALDPNLPLDGIRTLENVVAESVAQPRFYMLLLLLFAAVALVLAAVGIFGVMSFAVAQRRREIGIRMALGAPQTNVLRLVVGQALWLTGAGILIGLAAALGMTRLLESLLYGVAATDALALAGATALLATTALAASWLPARRAARMDPLLALKGE